MINDLPGDLTNNTQEQILKNLNACSEGHFIDKQVSLQKLYEFHIINSLVYISCQVISIILKCTW